MTDAWAPTGVTPRSAVVDALSAAPTWLCAAFAELSGDRAHWRPAKHEWSAAEVLLHVRASDAICAPRLVQVLLRDGVTLPAFDERAWAALISGARVPIPDQLDAFAVTRQELVAVLSVLDADAWTRVGEHEVRGRVRLLDLAGDMTRHEAEHRQQLAALVAVAAGTAQEGDSDH